MTKLMLSGRAGVFFLPSMVLQGFGLTFALAEVL